MPVVPGEVWVCEPLAGGEIKKNSKNKELRLVTANQHVRMAMTHTAGRVPGVLDLTGLAEGLA
jgi:hypothetical protein